MYLPPGEKLRLRVLRDRAVSEPNHGPNGDIRVHGNGFVQVDLSPTERLHVWGHPGIPRQAVDTQIHDHVFSFRSQVIVGRLLNVNYLLDEDPPRRPGEPVGPSHQAWQPVARRGQDTVLTPTGRVGHAVPTTYTLLQAESRRECYWMDSYVLHETFVNGPAASVITKDSAATSADVRGNPPATVLCLLGLSPSNSFDRYQALRVEAAWGIVREVLGRRSDLW